MKKKCLSRIKGDKSTHFYGLVYFIVFYGVLLLIAYIFMYFYSLYVPWDNCWIGMIENTTQLKYVDTVLHYPYWNCRHTEGIEEGSLLYIGKY